jgi:hypothetical protein
VSLEIEAHFSSSKGELLMIAWFEGQKAARMVLTGPAGEREEVQIKSIEASLKDVAKDVIAESFPPPGKTGALTAKIQVATERARIGRQVQLGNRASRADQLCEKLVAMADLLSKDAAIKQALGIIKKHLG